MASKKMEVMFFDVKSRLKGDNIKRMLLNGGPLITLLIIFIFLTFTSPNFLKYDNLLNVLRQGSVLAFLALGVSYVLIGGGVDLSTGSVLGLAGVTSVLVAESTGSVLLAIIVGLATGVTCGLFNSFFITRFKLMPFIVTLAARQIYAGITLIFTGGMVVTLRTQGYKIIGTGYLGSIPMPVVIMLCMFFIGYLILKRMKVGRYIHAIGSNEQTTRLTGIPIERYKIFTYIFSGLCAAVGGIILSARVGASLPYAGEGYEARAIASAVIGGTSMSGGEGTVRGTLIGAMIMAFIQNGLNLLRVDPYWHDISVGAVIIFAVIIDRKRQQIQTKLES